MLPALSLLGPSPSRDVDTSARGSANGLSVGIGGNTRGGANIRGGSSVSGLLSYGSAVGRTGIGGSSVSSLNSAGP